MYDGKHRKHICPTLISALALACVLLAPASQAPFRSAFAANGPRYITSFQAFHTVFTRNFSPFSAAVADFTAGAIYEPLVVVTGAGAGHVYPWLASGYAFTDGNRTLLLSIRHGVRWSDGVPFTAKDVLFTLTFGKVNPALDQIGYPSGNVTSVNLVGSDQVAVHFAKVDTTALWRVASAIKIVPEHIWSSIKNPATWTNPNPIGTGPFTQLINFSSQEYILGKNPYYWQPGKPAADGLKVPLFTSPDSANLATFNGSLDWSGDTVYDAQKVYVNRDPAHYHYYYPNGGGGSGLFFNTQKYPFSLVAFRHAISYALNRTKIWLIGEGGYAYPLDATGLNREFPAWEDKSLQPRAAELSTYNPAKARAVLAKAGFTWRSGQLYDPKGNQVRISTESDTQIPDYLADMQIIVPELRALGIDVSDRPAGATYFPDAAVGRTDMMLMYFNSGPTPYTGYDVYMSKESYVPIGQDASTTGYQNWERWWSPEATALLAQYRQTTDLATQHALIDKVQRIQVDNLPFIPLINNVQWSTYSTKNFTGWPTPSNFYAWPPPWWYPDIVKVLTTITPVT